MKNIRVTTWSHTSHSDIWPMYFGQFAKHAPELKQSIFVEKMTDKVPDRCIQIANKESDAYYDRFLQSLQQVEEDHIIYMQEDFVLYDRAKIEWMDKVNDFLEQSDYSFIRLIKSGIVPTPGHLVNEELKLWEIPNRCQYLFSCNAAIWKKVDFAKLYKFYMPRSILESELYGSHACRALGVKGCYIYDNEPKRASLHYDSAIFPHILSAVQGHSRGGPSKWQMTQYKKELIPLFEEYNIDPNVRGIV